MLGDEIVHTEKKAQKKEKKAMSVSLYGNLFFVIVELVTAIITSSQAVLLDAVYDGIEFFMLLPSIGLYANRNSLCCSQRNYDDSRYHWVNRKQPKPYASWRTSD